MTETDATSSRAEQRRRTEARILASASRLFVERGYERTTIRAIAGAAGVDGGLVMHYFGSKQGLFQRVTHARPVPELSGSAEQVTEQILARLAESLASEPVHSLALLRSMLTHPEAAQTLREGAARFQAQISRPIPAEDAAVRTTLVSAVMLGMIVSGHLLNSDALTAASHAAGHRPAAPVPALPDPRRPRPGRLTLPPRWPWTSPIAGRQRTQSRS